MGHQFTAVLAAEWQGILNQKWNPERLLIFSHVVLTRILDACKTREIRARIDHQLDL